MSENEFYLHGYNEVEQERLVRQAELIESMLYRDIEFARDARVLEIGCGVGAQSEILLRRFPRIHLMGLDPSEKQLATAARRLKAHSAFEGRYEVKWGNGMDTQLPPESFDGVFLCWVLEHIPDVLSVLKESKRVLRPGGKVYATEVMNFSFFLEPYSPNLWKYWMAFNDLQIQGGGDPFVGAKLGNYLTELEFRDIQTRILTWHLDRRQPEKRRAMIEYWTELLLSAEEQLISSGLVDRSTVEGMKAELEIVREHPQAVFVYSFMQASAHK